MYPHERSLVRKLANKPFAIVGVNSDRNLDKVRSTAAKKSISWRSFWNGEEGTQGPISKKWQITGWPTTYLIDKDGVIRHKNLRGEALDKAIEELMAEMGEEVKLVGIDHEAEDKAALEKAKEQAEAKAAQAEKAKTEEAPKAPEPSVEKAETVAPKPIEIQAPAVPAEAKPAEAKPAEAKPAVVKPAASKPTAAK